MPLADTTPGAGKVPVALGTGKLDPGWIDNSQVDDTGFTIVDVTDKTKKLNFDVSSTQTTAKTVTMATGSQTDDFTLTWPILTNDATIAILEQAQVYTAIQDFSAGLAIGAFGFDVNGDIDANDGTFGGDLAAVGGTFSGDLAANNLSGTNTGDITLAAIGSSPNANGATLTGQVLNLQPADATNGGSLTAGAQNIGGNKTLTGDLVIGTDPTGSAGIRTNKNIFMQGAAASSSRLTISGNAGNEAQGYYLQQNAAGIAFLWNQLNASFYFGTNDALRMYLSGSGLLYLYSTAAATSVAAAAAAFSLAGGVAIAKNLLVGTSQGWGVTSTVTAAGTTTLTSSSTVMQKFTGATTQTVQFPAANLFGAGIAVIFCINNQSSGIVTPTRAGSDTFQGGGTTDPIAAGTTQWYASDGVSQWMKV